jgi:hypothetical protein
MSRIILVAACGLTLAACSAMPSLELFKSSPPTVSLRIETEPEGAQVKAAGASCQTPCSLDVPAAGDFNVDLALNGYTSQSVPVHVMPPEDVREGDTPRLDPNPLYVQLEATPPAKKKKPAPKKPKTVASHAPKVASKPATKPAKPAPETAQAAPAGLPATAAEMTTSSVPTAAWPTSAQ